MKKIKAADCKLRIPDLFRNGLRRAILFAACFICLAASALDYPYYIPDDDNVRERFDIWVNDFGFRDEEGIFEDAFLLNCSPDSVDEKRDLFRISSIKQDEDGEWIVMVYDPETEEESFTARCMLTAMSGLRRLLLTAPTTRTPGSSGPG